MITKATDSAVTWKSWLAQRSVSSVVLMGWAMVVASTPAFSQSPVPPSGPATVAVSPASKPAWLTEFSLGLKESYDDNIYLSGVDQKFLPASYTVPPGSVAALKEQSSWITTVSPKLGVNFAPWFGDQQTLQVLSLVYAPDFATYHDAPTENFNAHRLAASVKVKTRAFSFSADNAFAYIDGSDQGPFYPGALNSAHATSAVRDRREQIQDRATVTFQFDQDKWFVRPTASLVYYDLMTAQLNVSGYQSYVDRQDVNGGVDFGCKINSRIAATLGYRYGHQYQQSLSYSPYSSSSDYHRVLLGLEGKPWKWLEVKLQGGPDFRQYADDTATHITPVNDKRPVKYYGEAILTAKLTTNDSVTFKFKQWQWISSSGKVPYFDSTYDLSYRRKVTDRLALDLGGRLASWDYTSGNLATCRRDDRLYTVSAGLGYAFNSHLSVNLADSLDLGRNAQDGVVNPATREYNRNLISLGALIKF